MEAMSTEQVAEELKKLPLEWSSINDTELVRVFKFKDFAEALAFVSMVGDKAEKSNHHPDIELSWGKVSVSISTHDVGGLTHKDFALAKLIGD